MFNKSIQQNIEEITKEFLRNIINSLTSVTYH
jgi:hypothetical protein